MKKLITSVIFISMFTCGFAAADTDSQPVGWFADGTPAGGTSHLTRTADAVFLTVDVQELPPGDVVTLWWIVFNNPALCATTPCSEADFAETPAVQIAVGNASGNVVKSDGTLELGAVLREGENEDGHQVLFNAGGDGESLLNAGGASQAEIHLVIQSHGQGRGGKKLLEQLAYFEANCTPACVDVQFAIHLP